MAYKHVYYNEVDMLKLAEIVHHYRMDRTDLKQTLGAFEDFLLEQETGYIWESE